MAIISRKHTHSQTTRILGSSVSDGFARRDWLELALAISLLGYSAWLVFTAFGK